MASVMPRPRCAPSPPGPMCLRGRTAMTRGLRAVRGSRRVNIAGRSCGVAVRADFRDRGGEAVAALGDGLDIVLLLRPLAERLPDHVNVLREVRAFDRRIGPQALEERLLL